MSVNYTPVPSVTPYLLSDKFQSFIVGPVGSTKTTASLMKIPIEAKKVAACADGIRRSRIAVVRNTRQMLLDSTIKDFLGLFPEGQAGTYLRTELRFILKFDDVEADILFRGLDDANDVRRLLSLQLSFAMVDEVREINSDVFDALTGRLGRYPNGMMVPHRAQWGHDDKGNPVQGCVDDMGNQVKKVWGATNPPDLDAHWEQYLTNADPEKVHVTIQPSGLSDEADWVQHLPSHYYEDLCEGKSEDWVDVYVHGKWGKSLSGLPVYDKTFTQDFHVAKEKLKAVQSADYPITIGIDFGRTPSAVFMQRDPRGRVLVLDEITSENMGLDTFINTKLNPFIGNNYQGHTFVCAPDPAGFMKQQASELTLVDQLKDAGYKCVKPPSNDPDKRIAAVERLLSQQLEGKAMFLVSPSCTQLIKGFRSGYRYKVKKNGEMEDKPDKNEWSHVHDALQYGSAVIDMNIRGFGLQQKRREVKKSTYAYT
jgi:phage terminase large subunit